MIEPFELNEENCPHSFGELLKDLRTNGERRMTLDMLADHIGYTRSVVSWS